VRENILLVSLKNDSKEAVFAQNEIELLITGDDSDCVIDNDLGLPVDIQAHVINDVTLIDQSNLRLKLLSRYVEPVHRHSAT
jgi:hypothetical protein